jgi:hypothetical protein
MQKGRNPMRGPEASGARPGRVPARVSLHVALLLLGVSPAVDPLQGQEPKLLVEAGVVREIRAVGSTVLGSADDPFNLSSAFPMVHRRLDGGYVVLSLHYELSSLALFDEKGRFTGELGGQGDGPGEHRRLVAFAAHALDSVVTVDASGRFNVFGPGGNFVRSGRMSPIPWLVRWLKDGRMIAAADSHQPSSAGVPLHLMSPDGTLIASFGSRPDEVMDLGSSSSQRRRIPIASGSGPEMRVYSVGPMTYRIDSWSPDGELQDSWVRRNEWFPVSPGKAAVITGVHEGSPGELWVAFAVADPRRFPEPEGRFSIGQMNRIVDTLVEVVHLSAGRILARGRVAGRAAGFSSAGELVTLEEDEIGVVRIRLLKLGIVE